MTLGGADPKTISIQRMALPEEIAESVVFLCCSQSAHITGSGPRHRRGLHRSPSHSAGHHDLWVS